MLKNKRKTAAAMTQYCLPFSCTKQRNLQDLWLTVDGQKWQQDGTPYRKINESKDANDPIMPEASSLSLASCSVSEVPSSPANGLDPLSLDIPYSPAPRHRRRSLQSPLRSSNSGPLDLAAIHPSSDTADLIEANEPLDSELSSSLLHLRRPCSPCQSEVFIRASHSDLPDNSTEETRPSSHSEETAQSTIIELQKQAGGCDESLDSLTCMCQKWRSFGELTPLGRYTQQPHPFTGENKTWLQGNERSSVSTHIWSTARLLANHSRNGSADNGQRSSNEQGAAMLPSISASAELYTAPGGAHLQSSCNETESTSRSERRGQGVSGRGHIASLPVQRRVRVHSAGDSARAGNQENLHHNIPQDSARRRPPYIELNGSSQKAGDSWAPETGPSPVAQPRNRRSTRSDGSSGRRLSGDAPAYMQSTASIRAKQSSRREQPNAKRWTVG